MTRRMAAMVTALVATGTLVVPAAAEPCTRETLRRVVDEAGARLRLLTAETQPKLQARLRQLKEKRGWTGGDGDDKAAALMSDDRTVELDTTAARLLARIDALSESAEAATPDCSRLGELEAASAELQATVRAKSLHIQARLDTAIAGETARAVAPAPEPGSAPPRSVAQTPESPPLRKQADVQRPNGDRPERAQPIAPSPTAPLPAPPKPPRAPAPGWTTETVERSAAPPPAPDAYKPPVVVAPVMPPRSATEDGFSRDEIREASQGFFGTLSGGLANVMEHAFSTLGRPNGYVLGSEGGGAFIAGVRYGKGTLFTRDGSKREVFWHGPSIGYDFGASGSKTLFLVYNLQSELDIFASYSGVDGSAFLVGGVGMTVLTDGKVVMAPIRSGVGVRLGANVGYVRFTARPTWNPF